MKTKSAKELGYNPIYTPMTKEQSENFVRVLMADPQDIKIDGKDIPFVLQVLNKRIEVMNLPINFTSQAKLLALILSNGNPGKMMIILIDCLINFEGKEVSGDDICNLYPMGFYNEISTTNYIDNYLKPHKCKWSEIY